MWAPGHLLPSRHLQRWPHVPQKSKAEQPISSQQSIIGICTQRISLLQGQASASQWRLQIHLVAATPAGATACRQADALPSNKLAVLGHQCLPASLSVAF